MHDHETLEKWEKKNITQDWKFSSRLHIALGREDGEKRQLISQFAKQSNFSRVIFFLLPILNGFNERNRILNEMRLLLNISSQLL